MEFETAHPDVRSIVVSHHALVRFRQRIPVRAAGRAAVTAALAEALDASHLTRWPPAWAVSDKPADWWAVAGDVCFPLAPTAKPGRWLAVTCLQRSAP